MARALRARRALGALLAAALAGCLDFGGGPRFPARERLDLAPEGARELHLERRLEDGAVARARFDTWGVCTMEPRFAPAPWRRGELAFVLAAALGEPLVRSGATLSYDLRHASELYATDARGRVLRLELDERGAAIEIELVSGFDPALPRRFTCVRSAEQLELRVEGTAGMRFVLR